MNIINILLLLIFNTLLWSKINSLKTNVEKSKNYAKSSSSHITIDINGVKGPGLLTETINGAETSANPQSQKYKNVLKPKDKITKNTKKDIKEDKKEEERVKKNEIMRDYYQNNILYREKKKENMKIYRQNNKPKFQECKRKYRLKKKNGKKILQEDFSKLGNDKVNNEEETLIITKNDYENKLGNMVNQEDDEEEVDYQIEADKKTEKKLKLNEYSRDYYQNNLLYKEKKKEKMKIYRQKHKKEFQEYDRKYRLKRKNKNKILQENEQGNLFVNPQTNNKGKEPIEVESDQINERNFILQDETFDKAEEEVFNQQMEDEQDDTGEPNKSRRNFEIDLNLPINEVNLNEKIYPFDQVNNVEGTSFNQQTDNCENSGKEPIIFQENIEEESLIPQNDNKKDFPKWSIKKLRTEKFEVIED
ncbi:hypothetical protein ACQ4LE_001762 [Meloidogyne hapla]